MTAGSRNRCSRAGCGLRRDGFASKEGDSLDVYLRFTPASPVPSTFDSKTYSAAKPGFYRIYRGNQGNDLLRAPGAADRVQQITVTASGPHLAKFFDGSQQLVSVVSLPWYHRATFLP